MGIDPNLGYKDHYTQRYQAISIPSINIHRDYTFLVSTSADLEVQLVQLNHCDGEYSNY